MKQFTPSAITCFEKRIEACHMPANIRPGDTIVSGYSYCSSANRPGALPENCDRRQVGVFYADIACNSRHTEENVGDTHYQLYESMALIKSYINANSGRVASFAADAILAEFKDTASALLCAIEVHQAASRWNANFCPAQQILFRTGVSFGDATINQYGRCDCRANLVARLESLAATSGICVDETVRNKLERHPSFSFVALGKQYVKNINEPVCTFWIDFNARGECEVEFDETREISLVTS